MMRWYFLFSAHSFYGIPLYSRFQRWEALNRSILVNKCIGGNSKQKFSQHSTFLVISGLIHEHKQV
jgi:hypothetical protein